MMRGSDSPVLRAPSTASMLSSSFSTRADRPATIWEAAALGRVVDVQRHLVLLGNKSNLGALNPVDVRDAGGWTPLMHAAFQGRATVSRWLIERGGADPDARDSFSQQRTPLIEASACGNLRVVRVLLSCDAPVSVDAQDARGCTALMLAAWRGHTDVVRELITHGARVDVCDRDAWTALAYAARFGRLEIARILLDHGAERDATSAAHERTPLMHAVQMGHVEVARMLLECGADASRTDRNGDLVVMMALEGDVHLLGVEEEGARLEMVRLLVERGASPVEVNAKGRTPLQVATEEEFSRIVAFLTLCQPLEVITAPPPKKELHTTADASFAFFEAVKNGDVPHVLSRVDVMLHGRDADGRTPLLLAAMYDQLDVLQLCLSRGANVSNRDDATASSALHFAARAGSPRAVTLLLNEGADVSMKDAQGLTPMDVAAAFGHVEIVEELFAGGASVQNVSKIDRQTIWHRAVDGNSVDVVRFLVSLSQRRSDDPNVPPDVNALNRDGYSALHIAASAGSTAIIALLLAVGADPNVLSNASGSKSTIVGSSTVRETEEEPTPEDKASDLSDVDGKIVGDEDSSTGVRHEAALHLAVAGGHLDAVELLLRHVGKGDCSVLVDIRDHRYRTPLLIAVARGYSDMAVLLLDAGADIEAAAHGQTAGNDAGRTSLLLASLHDHEQLVKTLLEYGARVDVISAIGETPISVAPNEEIRGVLELYLSSQEFHQRCFALLHGSDDARATDKVDGYDADNGSQSIAVASDELLELAGLVTSAYDLRFLMTISLHILDDSSDKNQPTAAAEVGVAAALKRAFELILAKKLVYDNDACVFFRLALEQCSKRGLVSARDYMRWKLEATKVNMESADWVVDLKRQVYENSWRAQTCAKNVELLAHGIKHVHAMAVANRDGMIACAHKVRNLEERLQDANRVMATAMTHMQSAIMTNAANIRDNRDRLANVDGRLMQFQERLKMNEANIQEVASHLKEMQHTQLANMERQRKHQMIKHGFGLVASLVGFVFAPMLKEVFDTVLDLSNPLEIAKCAFSEAFGGGGGDGLEASDIVDYLLTATGGGGDDGEEESSEDKGLRSNGLKPVIQSLLAKFGISGDEFTTVLRQEIVLQHPELIEEHEARGDLVVMGTTDTDGLHEVLASLEYQENDLSATLEEMRQYTQRIAAMEPAPVPLSPSFSPASSSSRLKPLKLNESDLASLPPLDGELVTAYAVAVPAMVPEISQSPLVAESVSVEVKSSSSEAFAVQAPETPVVDISSSRPSYDVAASLAKPATPPPPAQRDVPTTQHEAATEEEEDVIELAEDVALFPFHDAVVRSGGDLNAFKDAIQGTSGLNDYDPNTPMGMDAVVYSMASRTTLSAAEYAYCLGFDAIGDLLSSMITEDQAPMDQLPQARGATLSVEIEEDLDEFPYHYAVSESHGDVEECELFLEVAHEDGVPIDTRVHARIHREVRRSRIFMSAVELACRLGYVDVVKHFLVGLRVKTATKGVVLLGRAREQAKKKAPRVVVSPGLAA